MSFATVSKFLKGKFSVVHMQNRTLAGGVVRKGCGLIFIFAGEYLMQTFFFMQFIFEAFLIYTGVATITTDKDDEDYPSQSPMVLWLQKHLSVINAYDFKACFCGNV